MHTSGPWITRFAPSPTGALHLGNARTAVLNFLLARQSSGKFLLRLEDTDQERSSFAAEAAILWSLAWLGLTPDEPVQRQSLRLEHYTRAVRSLTVQGLAYPCFCTEPELEQERKEAARQGQPPRYSGRCAALSTAEQAERVGRGEAHAIRLRSNNDEQISFTDLIKGEITVPGQAFGDFVLLRSNGWPSYNLAVVVDDAAMGVNLVLRGEDHLTNTARQLLLYRAFGLTPPCFAHHGLLVDAAGQKLSKRSGALSILECRDKGLEPLAVVQYLASLSGALPAKGLYSGLEEMAQAFNPRALGRGNAVMSPEELAGLSARFFRAAPPERLAAALDAAMPTTDAWHGLDQPTRQQLAAGLRDNASCLDELRGLLPHFTARDATFSPEALSALAASLPVLKALEQLLAQALEERSPDFRLDKDLGSALLGQTGQLAGVKGKALYHPVRLALTGSEAGPELGILMTLLPLGRIADRIRTVLKIFSQ